MFLKINNPLRAEMFSILFQNLKIFSDNVNISFSEDGLDLQCIDGGQVAIMEVSIGKEWFDEYALEDEDDGTLIIGANTVIISKIVGTRDKIQDIYIGCKRGDDKLTLIFTSENKDVYDKRFEMPLIDLDMDIMEIPEMDYEAEFSLPSSIYANLISQLKLFGDSMDVDCSESSITLHSNSIESGKMSTEISIDDLNEFSIDENAELNLSYTLDRMYNVTQFHKIASDIELKFKQDFPVQLKYNLGTDDAYVVFYIAPKISDCD